MSACQFFEDKNILITGASGYLGNAIVGKLSNISKKIIRLSSRKLPKKKGCIDVMADISRAESWKENLLDVDIVVHLAAQTSFYKAEQDPAYDRISNFLPMCHLLDACQDFDKDPFIIFAGSATEIGIPDAYPVKESHPERPITFYDLHKLLSEKLLEGFVRQGKAKGTTLRLANLYGPGPESSTPDRGILNQMISRAIKGEKITVYGDGKAIRDYIYIDDVVEAFLTAGRMMNQVNGKHYLIGSGQGVSLVEAFNMVARKAEEMTGNVVEVVSIDEPKGLLAIEKRSFIADYSEFEKDTGWRPFKKIDNGIEDTIHSFLER